LFDSNSQEYILPIQLTRSGPPRHNFFNRLIGKLYLKLAGWKLEGELPDLPKFLVVVAPHTTNWDLPYMLAVSYAMNFRTNWFGKRELFHWSCGWFFKWLGGIPIERRKSTNMVAQIVEEINARERIVISIAPEGTRSKAEYWKSGFYHIAHQAEIPIVLGYLDYARKAGGLGPVLYPSGDIEADMQVIADFYKHVTPRYPHAVGKVAIRPHGAG
jgi:1-acyl-sn-glycerol-3-phosphate acyltransferase